MGVINRNVNNKNVGFCFPHLYCLRPQGNEKGCEYLIVRDGDGDGLHTDNFPNEDTQVVYADLCCCYSYTSASVSSFPNESLAERMGGPSFSGHWMSIAGSFHRSERSHSGA